MGDHSSTGGESIMVESFDDLKKQIQQNRERERRLLWFSRGISIDETISDRGPTEEQLFRRVVRRR